MEGWLEAHRTPVPQHNPGACPIRLPTRTWPRATVATALILIGTATATAGPMVVLYATPTINRAIVRPGAADALPVNGRLFVQEPNVGHLFAGDRDRPYRLSRVTGDQILRARSATAIAALLRGRVAASNCAFVGAGRAGCRSHLVFVDEIDARFAERAPNLDTPAWRSRTSRAQRKPVFPNYVPRLRTGQPGYELAKAMKLLATQPYGGGSYADRVHFYIAPGVVSSIGVGRGKYFNLGRDGRPHFRSYEGLRDALQRAGGAWLEMYHFTTATRSRTPFNTGEWSTYPAKFGRYLTGPGATSADPGLIAKVRFMMSRGAPPARAGAPAVCRNAALPQTCQFALASLPQNAPILANGVGQYRMEGDEAEWRALVKRLFFS